MSVNIWTNENGKLNLGEVDVKDGYVNIYMYVVSVLVC